MIKLLHVLTNVKKKGKYITEINLAQILTRSLPERTSNGDYCMERWFFAIASLFRKESFYKMLGIHLAYIKFYSESAIF